MESDYRLDQGLVWIFFLLFFYASWSQVRFRKRISTFYLASQKLWPFPLVTPIDFKTAEFLLSSCSLKNHN